MAKIELEMKCLHCGEDNMENFDIKFMDEIGLPDENWNITSGTQCNTCFERVAWRQLPTVEAKAEPVAIGDVICSNYENCTHTVCTHRVPHNRHETCEESYCDVKKLYVRCNEIKPEV